MCQTMWIALGIVDIAADLAVSRQIPMGNADEFIADTSCGGHQLYGTMEHEVTAVL